MIKTILVFEKKCKMLLESKELYTKVQLKVIHSRKFIHKNCNCLDMNHN